MQGAQQVWVPYWKEFDGVRTFKNNRKQKCTSFLDVLMSLQGHGCPILKKALGIGHYHQEGVTRVRGAFFW